MNTLEGHLLVASTDLSDPNFAKSVVLLIRHGEEGALGLVLNRRTTATVRQVWEQVSETDCRSPEVLHLGGPVQGPLMALHADESLQETQILPGLYFSAEPEHLQHLVAQEDAAARFFVGYAGWGEGQLEAELQQGSWLTSPATSEMVFCDEDSAWAQLTRHILGKQLISTLHIKHVPKDPTQN